MSKRYLTIYDLNLEKEWVLKNAYDIIETREINTVWELEFSIPKNDNDMQHCLPYHYVRYGDDGQLYRFTDQTKVNANESTVTYHCEHVIATLCDDVMFQGPYIKGNIGTYTNQVINYILNMQTPRNGVKNWKLGVCEPRRQFEYSWENENLLAAVWSVATCFGTPYMWTFDTSSYPWTLGLVNINENADPDFYMMAKKNILRSEESSSNLEICTRLYGLGEGEGVNQLTIKSVNNGLPYIQSSPEKIAEYGVISRIFVDRRYQYPETLKARMEALLKELENPTMQRTFEIVDLYDLSPDDMYKAEVGDVVLLKDDNTKVFITKTEKNHSTPGDMKITIATKAVDMASSIADLADRQRIEQVYSQGASQVYSFNFSGNATKEYPLNGYVYFPNDLKYLNEVKLKVKLDPFRSYSKSKSAFFDGGSISTENDGSVKSISTTGNDGGVNAFQTTGNDGGTKNFETPGTDGGTKNFETTGTDGGTKDFETSGTDGGTKNFETTGTDGGTKNFETTGNDGGTKNFETTGTDGGTSDLSTENGGGVDTTSSAGGAQDGTTSIASGGSGISLGDISIEVNVDNTSNAVWRYGADPYTRVTDPDLKMVANGGQHSHKINGSTTYTDTSDNTNHYHIIKDENIAVTEGSHTHTIYDNTTEDGGHSHTIARSNLQHYHTASASGSITVNNNEGNNQSGFAHSHNFKIKEHYHKFTTPAHSHTFDTPNHTHKFSLPNHTHKFSLPNHTHKFNLPNHTHKFNLPNHIHKFSLPNHTHKFNLPNHTHTFDTPNHTHTIIIGMHQHDLEAGIFTTGYPTQADLLINGTKKATITSADTELDITQLLLKNGSVPRGEWIQISIKPTNAAPNDLAFISVFGNVFAFIQSYTGGNF